MASLQPESHSLKPLLHTSMGSSASSESTTRQNSANPSERAALLIPSVSQSIESSMSRVVRANHQPQPTRFTSNVVSTTKYNALTFLPLFLFESFRRYSNAFFLFIACLQQIPDVSPTGRWTTLVPLSFILFVSACKEIFEDTKRRIADGGVNNRSVVVFSGDVSGSGNGRFDEICWRDVKVGDVVKVRNGEEIPSDLILISSSEPQGICYIETANLDGETNLKTRSPLHQTVGITTDDQLESLEATIECESPNRNLYEFTGNIRLGSSSQNIPLGPDQLLLRGSRLKNTEWVYGIVVFTGHDTKLMQNSKKGAILLLKRSQLDEFANRQILIMFGLLLLVCVISGTGNAIWRQYHTPRDWYLTPFLVDQHFGFSFLTFFILYNNLIPISLQVSLEMVRFFQTLFIGWDLEMYDETSDTPALARTSNLNEDLGQVKFVFSDKTGTVTENKMIFRQCSIGGMVFGVQETTSEQFVDSNLIAALGTTAPIAKSIHDFLLALALCHTVVPETNPADPERPFYLASSPDEAALVGAAAQLGYVFLKRQSDKVTIHLKNPKTGRFEEIDYELLDVLDFNSDRKRMSVIVRTPQGKILLICKGADSVICERLGPEQPVLDVTLQQLEDFAQKGYRTLCVSQVELSPDVYAQWKAKQKQAATAMDKRKEKINEVNELIEKELVLLGATAIEDRLQAGVPACIATLLDAGIKVWILTGDKMETAINIGRSCNLLTHDMRLILLKQPTFDGVREAVTKFRAELGDAVGKESPVGLVVDGKALYHALNAAVRKDFLDIAVSCKAVICCRVSPMQKADVITAVRARNPKDITLAIGDGANDVAMIQTAHVGVGISGKEGLQAVCASDYAVSQFRFLQKLLLVHGAWSYERIAKLILYCYHKNICLYIMQFYFAVASSFSGQTMFERWTIGLYNLAFTAAPPFVLGIFDKSCSAKSRMKYPKLYEPNQRGELFNYTVFWRWIATSLFHALLIFCITFGIFYRETVWPDGTNSGGFVFGAAAYTYVIVVVCLKAGLETSSWTLLSHIGIWGSIVSWFIYIPIYSNLWPHLLNFGDDFVGMERALFGSWVFWFGLLIVPVVTLMADVCFKCLWNTWYPTVVDQVRQIERHGDEREFVWEPILGRLLPRQRDSGVMLDSSLNGVVAPQRGYAFSQDEGGLVTQAEIALHENTDARYAERMARRSRESLAASSSSLQGSPRSLGRDVKIKGGMKIKHL